MLFCPPKKQKRCFSFFPNESTLFVPENKMHYFCCTVVCSSNKQNVFLLCSCVLSSIHSKNRHEIALSKRVYFTSFIYLSSQNKNKILRTWYIFLFSQDEQLFSGPPANKNFVIKDTTLSLNECIKSTINQPHSSQHARTRTLRSLAVFYS